MVYDLLTASDDWSRLRQGGRGEGYQQLDRSQYNKKLDLLLGLYAKLLHQSFEKSNHALLAHQKCACVFSPL